MSTRRTRPLPITHDLAAWAAGLEWDALPQAIQHEAVRAFLNWFGCALGGSGELVVDRAMRATALTGGAAQASVIGRNLRTDMASAAFLNCLASSALAYDDTHLPTVTHPTGPVAAALLAYAECKPLSGKDLLAALIAGIEIQCRLSNMLLMPPAKANLSLYITGITGPVGAAAALGRAMRLNPQQMRWAIGYAATQGAGFRATHGAMSGLMVPAFAARAGLFAAQLANAGVECREDVLEAPKGFAEIFTTDADLGHATRALGEQWEVLANAYKPYPCGIVVQPAIDACREIVAQMVPQERVETATLHVHPLTMSLADRRHPKTMFEAQVSLHHWAACVFIRQAYGIAEVRQPIIDDPAIAGLRDRIEGQADAQLGREQARAIVRLTNGRTLTAFVEHARGSARRPMTDAELHEKFLEQSNMVFEPEKSRSLLAKMLQLATEADAGLAMRQALSA